ncbi:VCBS repeat-containing protein [Micromonospora sp. WMMD1102]|uniref:FG-GAP repeat domain-containing protein n=1 Tax=Micromonospora sp. WMMD1102 TaxID=3016105 RepID=UPI002414FFF1|nr:VCBS repeat-containing protein [Micromonospora sp. WMMD1102]MDG4789588.1 VCBS repeat-containing protein [Micromonospora sp. WMMD1102]
MRRRAIAALAATAAIPPVLAWASASGAARPNEPFLGDVDGDGVVDRVRLGVARPDCAVWVEGGRPDGGYQPAQRYTYRAPGAGRSARCPELGVAVDLDPGQPTVPGRAELVVGWYAGPPDRSGQDLLVLRNFAVSARMPALDSPNEIGLADFDGDRRPDVYLWTDQGEGFATYLNSGTGTLVPGPVRFCAARVQQRLADFDRDGAMDVAIAYADRCDDGSDGVVVVLDAGTTVGLQRDHHGRVGWTVDVLNADRGGTSDVLTYRQPTGEPGTFLGTGDGRFVSAPLAVPDTATVPVGGSVHIPLLANDWCGRRCQLTVVVPPSSGSVEVSGSHAVSYRPDATVESTDRFVYRLVQDGRTSEASVVVRVVL